MAPCVHLLLLIAKPLPLQITAAAGEEGYLYNIGLLVVEVEKPYMLENGQLNMLFSFPEHLARSQTNEDCLKPLLAKDSV